MVGQNSITPATRAKVERLLKAKGASFEREAIYRASQAAGPMAGWVKANLEYSVCLERVAPLQAQLDAVTAGLAASGARLRECEAELVALDGSVGALKLDFQRSVREAEALRLELQKAEAAVAAAGTLLGQLAGERARWAAQEAALAGAREALPKEALAAAGFVVHLAGQPEGARAAAATEWARLLGLAPGFDAARFLAEEEETLAWVARGLPSDSLSVNNAAAALAAWPACPLIVDPSGRAASWLVAQLEADAAAAAAAASAEAGPSTSRAGAAGGGMPQRQQQQAPPPTAPPEVVALHDPRFPAALERAARFGKALIVADADRLEPLLYPLLRGDAAHTAGGGGGGGIGGGGRAAVQIGERLVEVDPSFRLFLTTRSAAALDALAPDAAPLVAVANFVASREGLEARLLAAAIRAERPALEAQKAALAAQASALKRELAALERQLLRALASSRCGCVLESGPGGVKTWLQAYVPHVKWHPSDVSHPSSYPLPHPPPSAPCCSGNLLEDAALLASLSDTKAKAATAAAALERGEALAAALDAQRDGEHMRTHRLRAGALGCIHCFEVLLVNHVSLTPA